MLRKALRGKCSNHIYLANREIVALIEINRLENMQTSYSEVSSCGATRNDNRRIKRIVMVHAMTCTPFREHMQARTFRSSALGYLEITI